VKLEIYDGLSHAYLNLIDFIPEAYFASNNICEWILKFIFDIEGFGKFFDFKKFIDVHDIKETDNFENVKSKNIDIDENFGNENIELNVSDNDDENINLL
jgi:hypothetical protein